MYLNQTLTKHWQEFDRIKQTLDNVNLNEIVTQVPVDAKRLFDEVRKLDKIIRNVTTVKEQEEELINLVNNVDKLKFKMKATVLKLKLNVTNCKSDMFKNIEELKQEISEVEELFPQAKEMYQRSLNKSDINLHRNETMTVIVKETQKMYIDISTTITAIKDNAKEVETLCNSTCREVENLENDHIEFLASVEEYQNLIDFFKTLYLIKNNFSEIKATYVQAKSLKLPPFPNLTLLDFDYSKNAKKINAKNKNVQNRLSKSEDLIGKIKDYSDELESIQKYLKLLEFLDDLSSKLKE